MIELPGVCQGHVLHGCEPCHANWHEYGKGLGIKSHDCFFAAGCHACHVEIDLGNRFSAADKKFHWRRGFERTVRFLWVNGLVEVV